MCGLKMFEKSNVSGVTEESPVKAPDCPGIALLNGSLPEGSL